MPETKMINQSFALAQFSGNQQLMLKMFDRFLQEYQKVNEQISQMLIGKDLDGAKQKLHTLKGVSGNLGFSALHNACESLERQIIQNKVLDEASQHFEQTLSRTLAELSQLLTKQNTEPHNLFTTNENGKQLLLEALNAGKFIPPETLTEWLSDSCLGEHQLVEVESAISALDYPKALKLLQD